MVFSAARGAKISCEIKRSQRDDTPGLGLVVPCLYKFEGKENLVVYKTLRSLGQRQKLELG